MGSFYQIVATLHILFASIWLVSFLLDSLVYGNFKRSDKKDVKLNSVSMYLKGTNLFGIIGAMGILVTGIFMVVSGPYQFFQFTANHWLTTKQIITVILLIMIFASIIPKAKNIRKEMDQTAKEGALPETFEASVKKLRKVNMTTNVLVLINFLLALSRWIM